MQQNSKILKEWKVKYPSGQTQKKYLLKCSCGKEYEQLHTSMIKQIKVYGISSCGCLGKYKTKHLKYGNILKNRLHSILGRVSNGFPSQKKSIKLGRTRQCYADIKICDEWKNDFMSFYTWAMNNNFKPNLHIDRIDGTKDYTPDNCRWITQQENNRNGARSKLSKGDVINILKLHGIFSNISIAKYYNITSPIVTNIARGVIWNDIWEEHHTDRNLKRSKPSDTINGTMEQIRQYLN